MPVLRAVALVLTILLFLVVVSPLYLLFIRFRPSARAAMPLLFCRIMCRFLRVRVRPRGEMARERPLLLVPNHISWVDIVVLGSTEFTAFLAKKEVAGWPLLGPLAKVQGALFVDRGRKRQIPAVNRQMAERMQAGDPVILFAEATTGDGTHLLKFHTPHFEACRDLMKAFPEVATVYVQPIVIDYNRRDGLALGRAGRANIAWYGDTGFTPHLWSMLKSGPTECLVDYLPPRPMALADHRKAMAAMLQSDIRQNRWRRVP